MLHPLCHLLSRELVLLKRYVLPIAPERNGGFPLKIHDGALRETTFKFFII
jgi:hypothetical protein